MSWAPAALPPHFSDDELTPHCDLWTSEFPWWACLAGEHSTSVWVGKTSSRHASLWITHTEVSSNWMENRAQRMMLTKRRELWHKGLADHQRVFLLLQSAELLLESMYSSKDYLLQHSLHIGVVTWLVFTNWIWVEVMCISSNTKWERSKCAFSTLFFTTNQQKREDSETQEEGRAIR